MAYPSTRGWGAPGCTRTQLVRITVPGIPLNLRAEVAPLFEELVRWLTAERTRLGRPALSSSGGYVKRYISGTTTWSNHSWGLAADFNAATNPYAYNGGTDMPPGTSAKAKSLGMRWGGDYAGKKDAMHFEFMGTPADAKRLVAELRADQSRTQQAVAAIMSAAKRVAPVRTARSVAQSKATQVALHQRADGYWGDGTDHAVNLVRHAINGGFPSGIAATQRVVGARADGDWGPKSRAALVATIKRLQAAWGVGADGRWGPKTEAAWVAARQRNYKTW